MARARPVLRRRALSMTSLIDVIFLLLLFFMLSSTFTRFGEVTLSTAAAGTPSTDGAPPVFLRLGEESLTVNGVALALPEASAEVARLGGDAPRVLLQPLAGLTAQRLVDALGALRSGVPGLSLSVLGTS